jgi:hypothetical protein
MKEASPLHCAARRMKRTLKAGQAPACWKKQVERSAQRNMRLHQFCAWAEKVAATRPRLQEKPIFGECLAELVLPGQRGEAGEAPPAKPTADDIAWPWKRNTASKTGAATGLHRRTEQATAKPSVRTMRGAGSVQPAAAHMAPLQKTIVQAATLKKASRALLARLGGGTSLADRQTASTARRTGVQAYRRRQPLPGQHTSLNWYGVAQTRIQQILDLARDDRSTQATTGLALEQPPGGGSSEMTSWQIDLHGPAAAIDLLERLAGVASPEVLSPGDAARPGGSPRRPAAESLTRIPASPKDLPGRIPGGRLINDTAQAAVASPRVTASEFTPMNPPVAAAIAPPRVTGSEFTPLAPPGATVSFPALSPPLKPYDPTLPAASATLQYGARREAVDAMPEDLDVLAAKIKRILDDEARRHGIDV